MRQTVDPTVEWSLRPVLWSAVSMAVLGLAVNLLGRPGLVLPVAFLAGAVASFSTGYYESSGSNAVIGVVIGLIGLLPILALLRVVLVFEIQVPGDVLFVGAVLAAAMFLVVITLMIPIAYLGALVGDRVRRTLDGPMGY